MKVAPKKVFCSNCQKLVNGEEQKTDSTVKVVCSKCKKPVWIKDGFSWRYIKEE